MNPPGGAATQICAHRFDRRFFALSAQIQKRIQDELDRLGLNLHNFAHYRMQGVGSYRLRVGDYRVIYEFNVGRNELYLLAVGHRRDIYKETLN
jgi:mRNA interferase RelE/StbE